MLEPEEKKEIVDTFRHEFKQFRINKIDPLCKSVELVGQRVIAHGEKLATQAAEIKSAQAAIKSTDETVADNEKTNRASHGRLTWFILSGLISIIVAILGLVIYGG